MSADVTPTPGGADALIGRPYVRPSSSLEGLLSKAVARPEDVEPEQPVFQFPEPESEGAEETPEAPQEATGDTQTHDQPPVQGNPFARIRVLERERERERKRAEELQQQMTTLLKAVEEKLGGGEEEEIVENLDPISRLERANQNLDKKLDKLVEHTQLTKEQEEMMRAESIANEKIREFAAKADGVEKDLYVKATTHLVNVWLSERLTTTDESLEEAQVNVAKNIAGLKLKYLKQGLNPGEEFFKLSALHGFVPSKPTAKPATDKAKVDPKADIAKERAKKESLGSIGTLAGGASAGTTTKNLSNLNEKEYAAAMMALAKERGNMRRSIPLSETLAHKMK